ncbi:MAG: TauD/TfdA dioxygenase family protein, partial [Pseudorhodoplanes sp.]|uniref:TauD/TfdA dioxygenase family protein n=1 Tax=Pseudorhodoplanes sp. TaxID=1934341 RepID=UPI003D0BEBCE
MPLKIRRLSYALGAEIIGADLTKPMSEEAFAEIRHAFHEHLVLLFRDQVLTPEQHIAFSRRFGELDVHPFSRYNLPGYPEVLQITNHVIDGKPSDTRNTGRQWHSDLSFTTRPALGSLLYCKEVPEVGGNTMFANMYMAYETLSPGLREMLDRLWAVHDMSMGKDIANRDPAFMAEMKKKNPPVAQPVVRIHPETGRKALYVSEMVTSHFEGWTFDESRPLLNYLFAHSVQPEFTYRQQWRPHDLLMWDNRSAMHLAVADFDHSTPRHMLRTQISGEALGRVAGQPAAQSTSAAA